MNRAKSKSRKTCPIRNPVRRARQETCFFNAVVANGFHLDQRIHASAIQKSDLLIDVSSQNFAVERLGAPHYELARSPGEHCTRVRSAVSGIWSERYELWGHCAVEGQTAALAAVDY